MAFRMIALALMQPTLVAADMKPLITTDVFYATSDLLSGAFNQAWTLSGVDGLLAQVPVA
eukprot:CAMPEP_0176202402 /NCGR_PEP_ID=MMETSP0121_2-20121125/10054_1 /TAXON_ID=160619 /ORGANISM="Kryptoperidinium foliaceum, Strain CCMP 1326" /LENGTH=59 /DNA_ID=CAMNT_0017541291 /DNA_START=67 /DNA_END=243 /DNA_ORIENTATION=+